MSEPAVISREPHLPRATTATSPSKAPPMRSASFSEAADRPPIMTSARSENAAPASRALATAPSTCTPTRNARSRCSRRAKSMAASKPPSGARASAASRAGMSVGGSTASKKLGSSSASRAAGRRARVRANCGAKAITRTTSSSIRGWARNNDCTCTPEDRRSKNSLKRRNAVSGAPVAWAASSRRGARRVKSSRPRSVRLAAIRPWCQPRTVAATCAGWEKPIRFSVARVAGSSSTPVNTRLPKRELSCSSPANSSP